MKMLQALSHEEQMVSTVDVLSAGIERLREEHRVLKHELMEFYGMAKVIGQDDQVTNWSVSLSNLRRKILAFMDAMDAHSEWEDLVLFPMVQEYTGKDMGPIAVMEHEQELAKQNVRRFLEAAEQLSVPVTCQDAKEAASFLLQAYIILTDHFTKEEEVLFPLAEQMLTDIEQFFSC
jgi:regulator of cell morphogenesis and NO signaling